MIKTRNFGRTSLLDVRRKLVHFCVDHLALPPGHPIRMSLYDPHPALKAVWDAPAQERRCGRWWTRSWTALPGG